MRFGHHEIIVVMGGSFNPPTLAHQRLMLAAVEAMGADRGVFVPVPHAYLCIKMRRDRHPGEVLAEPVRLRMLEAMAAEDPRLLVDDLEYHRTEKGYTYETMEALQQKYPDARLLFVAGGDKIGPIARWHRIREFLDRFQILLVRRDGEEPETVLRAHPFLSQYQDRFCIMPAPDGLEGISSSAVREKLRNGESGAAEMLHPVVWQLLQENGGVKR